MEPIQIKYELIVKGENESKIENKYKGKKEENLITYKEGNIDVMLTFLEEKVVMKRRTEEYEIEMPFQKNGICEGKYHILDMNLPMHLIVTTEKFLVENNTLEIAYHLLLNEESLGWFNFKLEYEVVK